MKREDIELLLFDLGGVLIELDFSRMFRAWAAYSTYSPEDIGHRFKMDRAYEQHERGALEAAGYFAHLKAVLALEASDQDVRLGWNQMFVGLIDDTAGLLRRLDPAVRLCALTNSNRAHEDYWRVEYAAALEVFECIFVSSTMGVRKPERAAFERIAERTGVPAERTLFFDDTLGNVEGARDAGLHAVHVQRPEDVSRALRDAGFL